MIEPLKFDTVYACAEASDDGPYLLVCQASEQVCLNMDEAKALADWLNDAIASLSISD